MSDDDKQQCAYPQARPYVLSWQEYTGTAATTSGTTRHVLFWGYDAADALLAWKIDTERTTWLHRRDVQISPVVTRTHRLLLDEWEQRQALEALGGVR